MGMGRCTSSVRTRNRRGDRSPIGEGGLRERDVVWLHLGRDQCLTFLLVPRWLVYIKLHNRRVFAGDSKARPRCSERTTSMDLETASSDHAAHDKVRARGTEVHRAWAVAKVCCRDKFGTSTVPGNFLRRQEGSSASGPPIETALRPRTATTSNDQSPQRESEEFPRIKGDSLQSENEAGAWCCRRLLPISRPVSA